jgi:hypothetical protein
MLKKMALVFMLAAGFGAAKAQNIEFESGNSKTYVMGHSGSTDCHLVFRNMTGGKADFVYRKIQDDFPTQWWVSFCDNINCYASLIDQDTFAPVADSNYAEFKVTVTPNGKAATSVVKYELYAVQTPSQKDTVTFTFVVEWGAAIGDIKEKGLSMYPNPASDMLHIDKKDARVEIFTASGKLVQSSVVASDHTISIASLPAGFYYVSCEDKGQMFKASFVKK